MALKNPNNLSRLEQYILNQQPQHVELPRTYRKLRSDSPRYLLMISGPLINCTCTGRERERERERDSWLCVAHAYPVHIPCRQLSEHG